LYKTGIETLSFITFFLTKLILFCSINSLDYFEKPAVGVSLNQNAKTKHISHSHCGGKAPIPAGSPARSFVHLEFFFDLWPIPLIKLQISPNNTIFPPVSAATGGDFE
jgi:hypothetical protein